MCVWCRISLNIIVPWIISDLRFSDYSAPFFNDNNNPSNLSKLLLLSNVTCYLLFVILREYHTLESLSYYKNALEISFATLNKYCMVQEVSLWLSSNELN